MGIEKFVRNPIGLTYLVIKKELVQSLIIDHKLDCELDEIEVRMLKNELEFIELELKLINLELKRESIMADKTKTAIKVPIIESERGWGQKIDDYVICIDSETAKAFIIEYNSKNTESKTPDWYMYASNDISTIELTRNQFNYIVNHGNTWLNHLKTIK